jgi:hypothetical protein
MIFRATVLCAAIALAACAQGQQPSSGPAALRETHQGTLRIGAKTIPLPPGEWQVLGSIDENVWRRMILVQEQNGRMTGQITLASSLPNWTVSTTWGTALIWGCQDARGNLVPTIRNTDNVMSGWDCLRITTSNERTRRVTAVQEQQFAARRDAQPEWAPERMLVASFSRGEPMGGFFITYKFDPSASGPSTRSAEDDKNRIVRWAEATAPLIVRGFNGNTSPAPAF